MTDVQRSRGSYAKSAARRQSIISAASEVFRRDGYRGASLRSVAERASLSHTGLLHHYPTKEALLEEVLRMRDERARLELATPAYGVEALRGVLRVLELNAEEPELIALFHVLSAEASAEDHPARAFFIERDARTSADFELMFEQVQSEGLLADGVTPAQAALLFASAIDGLQGHWLLRKGSFDLASQVSILLRTLTTADF